MNKTELESIAKQLSAPNFKICPFCFKNLNQEARVEDIKTKLSYYMECPVCGIIKISSNLKNNIRTAFDYKSQGGLEDDILSGSDIELYRLIFNNLYIVASYLYERKNKEQLFDIDKEKFVEIAHNSDLPKMLLEKRDKLLISIYKKTEFFGDTIKIKKNEWYLCYAKNKKEFINILNQCQNDKLLVSNETPKIQVSVIPDDKYSSLPRKDDSYIELWLTQEGFTKVEKILNEIKNKVSNNAFIVMKLDGPKGKYQKFYECNVKPAMQKAGYNALPIIDKSTNELIITEIMTEIKKSAFVVVIMAEHYPILNREKVLKKESHDSNYNIYWEAGFAKGCGKEVFLLYPASINKVRIPFDLHSFRHYRYDETQIFKKQDDLINLLSSNIIEIVGKGLL